ncbi:F-box/WD repeat-containing protein 9 isoform X2 [Brachyhypopomus gauderio]|uniref:F-box/WD repeat-containing protein 9 isoform X2 n=1 Tax=Brachyhypopomus gauderio TaxID=698409 RepID=UPI004041F32B
MSMPQVTLEEEKERGREKEREKERGRQSFSGGSQSPTNLATNDTLQSGHLGLTLGRPHNSPETSPSPSGLLSLPWEMVVRIASHLPARCVISVLPQVCRALGELGEDTSAWQLRAHRLTGHRTSFPVGPRERFDWPAACLEMEQLMERWMEQEESSQEVENGQDVQDGAGGVEVTAAGGVANGEMQEAVGEGAAMHPDAPGQDDRPDGGWSRGPTEAPPAIRGDAVRNGASAGIRDQEPEDRVATGTDAGQDDRERPEARCGGGEGQGCVHGADNDDERSDCAPARSPGHARVQERITLPPGHIADVNAVLLVGGEGAVCASGSRDRNVNLWDLRQGPRGTLLRTLGARGSFSTHLGWVWSLAAGGPLLASGSFDSTIRLWDLEAGGAEMGLIRGRAAVLCLSCQANALLAGSHDQKVSIYDTRAAQPLVKSLRLHGDAVLCLASDEQYIVSGSKDQTVAVFDCRARKLLHRVQLNSYFLSMSYSGQEVWAGDNHGLVHTFSMSNGSFKPIAQFNVGHSSLVTGVHHSPGSLYTCSSDRTIKLRLVHASSDSPHTRSSHRTRSSRWLGRNPSEISQG